MASQRPETIQIIMIRIHTVEEPEQEIEQEPYPTAHDIEWILENTS